MALDTKPRSIRFFAQDKCNYTKEEAELDWTRWLLGLYRVAHRPKILCFWVGGHAARKVEALTDERVKDDCMAFIRRMLREEVPEGIPDPKAIKVRGLQCYLLSGVKKK